MKSKWFVKNKKVEAVLPDERIHPGIMKILANRGIKTKEQIHEYLHGTMQDIPDGMLMKDMGLAVEILCREINSNKKIRIMGDYDVDGVASTFILYKALKNLGADCDFTSSDCDFFIPDRIKDGYGLHMDVIEKAAEDGVDVILTCDNGIAAYSEVERAIELGMTVIVTDHHEIPYVEENGTKKYIVPKAHAVVDPKQIDCSYPNKGICGAVVAMHLVYCLYEKLNRLHELDDLQIIEFAALATVCDVMELQNENRIIVKEGLRRIPNTKNLGLQALLSLWELKDKELTSYDIGFRLGPTINAAGRLENASQSLKLFLETDENMALEQAKSLFELNQERKLLTEQGVEKAFEIIEEEKKSNKVLVVYLPGLHESIAGIVAGKIREKYNKPAIVLTDAKHGLKGSGRSIEAYSMYEELNKVKDLMIGFGGHPLAAGLSLEPENLEAFEKALNNKSTLTPEDFIVKSYIDLVMPLEILSEEFIEQLSILEPFGKGNEKPVFAERHMRAKTLKIVGKNSNVLRVEIDNPKCRTGVCFDNVDETYAYLTEKHEDFSAIYYPSINEWNGHRSLQIIIRDVL